MTELYRLCYVSHNRIEHFRRAAELRSILERSAVANRTAGITGVLIVSGGYFCQAIEGSCAAVEQLFEAIQLDDRHEDITVLEFVPIANRLFSGWDMAHFDADNEHHNERQIRALVLQLNVVETGRNIVNVFAQLIERRERDMNRAGSAGGSNS